VGTLEDVIEKRAYFPFYMHRTGHWLGMDVHDCGSYVEPVRGRQVSERKDRCRRDHQEPPSRILPPGMVLTIEPRGSTCAGRRACPERFHHIGIRIEDDAIVTPAGLRADHARRAGEGRTRSKR
jgi:Xaa-Pro aminopeptidase